MDSASPQTTRLDSLARWRYHILFGVWLVGTGAAFHRIRRQPFRQAVKIEQYETIFKGTSLAAAVTAIAMSGKKRSQSAG